MLKCKEAGGTDFEGMKADDPDLRPFRKTGNKVLLYHGLADEIDSSAFTGGIESTQQFHRLCLVPGMGHCVRAHGCVCTVVIPIPTLEEIF